MNVAQRLAQIEEIQTRVNADSSEQYTRWQWEQYGAIQFWNKHFSVFGLNRILRGKDLQQHLQQRAPTEAKSRIPMLYLFCYATLWLGTMLLGWGYSDLYFTVCSTYFGVVLTCTTGALTQFRSVLAIWVKSKPIWKLLNLLVCLVVPIIASIPILFDSKLGQDISSDKRSLFLGILGYLSLFFVITEIFCVCAGLSYCGVPDEFRRSDYFEDDELILLSPSCNAALPSVGTRFSSFKSNYPIGSKFTAAIERKLWRLAGTNAGITLLEQSCVTRFQSEAGLLNAPIFRRYLCDVYSRRWRNPPKHLLKLRCRLCTQLLQLGDMVLYPKTRENHGYFFHRKCFESATVDDIGQWFDCLDAVANMRYGFPGFPTSLPELDGNCQYVKPQEAINWEQLRAYAQRTAA